MDERGRGSRRVSKLYRRYGRRKNFGTLKSALLAGRGLPDLRPDATFEALKGVSFDVAPAARWASSAATAQARARC